MRSRLLLALMLCLGVAAGRTAPIPLGALAGALAPPGNNSAYYRFIVHTTRIPSNWPCTAAGGCIIDRVPLPVRPASLSVMCWRTDEAWEAATQASFCSSDLLVYWKDDEVRILGTHYDNALPGSTVQTTIMFHPGLPKLPTGSLTPGT